MAEIKHLRFYFKFINSLRIALNNEQMGRLFFALADYAEGKEPEVAPDILFPFNAGARQIDKVKSGAYEVK